MPSGPLGEEQMEKFATFIFFLPQWMAFVGSFSISDASWSTTVRFLKKNSSVPSYYVKIRESVPVRTWQNFLQLNMYIRLSYFWNKLEKCAFGVCKT